MCLAEHNTEDLTVALGRNAFKRNTLDAICENRAVNPKDLELQPDFVPFPNLPDGEPSSEYKASSEQAMADDESMEDQYSSGQDTPWPLTDEEIIHCNDATPDAGAFPQILEDTCSGKSPTPSWPLSLDMGSSSDDAGIPEPVTPLTYVSSDASVGQSKSLLPDACSSVDVLAAQVFISDPHHNTILLRAAEAATSRRRIPIVEDLVSSVAIVDDADRSESDFTWINLHSSDICKTAEPTKRSSQNEISPIQDEPMDLVTPEEQENGKKVIACPDTLPSSHNCTQCSFKGPTRGKLK